MFPIVPLAYWDINIRRSMIKRPNRNFYQLTDWLIWRTEKADGVWDAERGLERVTYSSNAEDKLNKRARVREMISAGHD